VQLHIKGMGHMPQIESSAGRTVIDGTSII